MNSRPRTRQFAVDIFYELHVLRACNTIREKRTTAESIIAELRDNETSVT